MPVDWPFAAEVIRLGGVGRDAHPREYGDRQTATARAILDALVKQPGIVLADEVGMGKTYVALAVAASVLLATRGSGRPVVVMMPPGLLRKWADEWTRFIGHCVADPKSLAWVNTAEVRTATDFFKVLDNRGAERAHLIFMPTNALSRGLQDAWIRLALIRLARTRTKLSRRQRGGLFRWAAELVKLKRYEKRLTEHVIRRLLGTDLADWRQLLIRVGLLAPSDDDPVPEHLRKHAGELNWQRLAATLRHRIIPGRKGRVSKERLATARDQLREAFADLYEQWLACARWRASLLILDEAHHAKNDDTRLASLLRAEGSTELVETDERRKRPRLQDKFDRMLFLTATPFQLGHRELIRVLRSFASARWSGAQTPTGTRAEFLRALVELERRLDAYHLGARHLDRTWGRLAESLIAPAAIGSSVEETVERWWRQVASSGDDEVTHEIVRAIRECQDAKRRAELDGAAPWQSLRTWVIRHNRPSALPARRGEPARNRREHHLGDAVETTAEKRMNGSARGLSLAGDLALPFLLAARFQGEIAAASASGRALFAEGLASSYEAFHHTRDGRSKRDERAEEQSEPVRTLVPARWYEKQIERVIPSLDSREDDRFQHPKIRAVVERAVSLWAKGEKVLVFCFYSQTARALRTHLSREVGRRIESLAAAKLSVPAIDARATIERIARRLSDQEGPFRKELEALLRAPFEQPTFAALAARREELVALMGAFVRSPAFIARYLPLERAGVRRALAGGESRPRIVRTGAREMVEAIREHTDASGLSLLQLVDQFLRFANELAEQRPGECDDEDGAVDPLSEYIDAVTAYVSPRRTLIDEDLGRHRERRLRGAFRALPTVRMVYGDTDRQVRERILLAFNSPLFPEILVSSRVLGEGVDLHRFCRHVIHHDLDWNPSVIEQCTGRIDRIGCKAEVTGWPIQIYEPFIAGGADEKKYRVVRDRERWFQIVMGQSFTFSERDADEIAGRLPLPPSLAAELVFDLRRYTGPPS